MLLVFGMKLFQTSYSGVRILEGETILNAIYFYFQEEEEETVLKNDEG